MKTGMKTSLGKRRMEACPAMSRRKGRRGSALVTALFACVVLAGVVIVSFNSSNTAGRSVTLHESNAASLAAAEYGANLAITEICSWGNRVDSDKSDWVYGKSGETLYISPSNDQSVDQRRFGGVFDDQDFRVMIRSADLARKHNTKPAGWLWTPAEGETLYEIISTSRSTMAGKGASAERLTEASVQTVVSLFFQDGWDKNKEFGALYLSQPPNFQTDMANNPADFSQAVSGVGVSGGPVPNVLISGEDHDINKYYVEKFETERIVTPLKLISSSANFLLADGGYWRGGNLTLNYRMEPHLDDANPHRPSTTSFGTGDNRKMYVPYPARQYDTYLLGGKVHGGEGRTVKVDLNKTSGGIVGEVIETNGSGVSQGGAFNLVLGQFEDLRNLYINMAGLDGGSFLDADRWWQMYVGQYTHLARGSSYTNSALKSYPNYGGTRIRAQTAHLMKNAGGEVLVRLFKDSGGKLYKYPASNTTWTGYYCWASVNIAKASGVTLTKKVTATTTIPGEEKGAQAVARTFFWQELVGYQLVRRKEHTVKLDPMGRDTPIEGTVTYPNEPAVFTQRDLPLGSRQKIDKRTMYRLDGDGKRLDAGFDEIYQAHKDAGVPGNQTNSRHPLYGDKYTDVSPGYIEDRFDAIYVWENGAWEDNVWKPGTAKVVKKAKMNDFLFEKDFGTDDHGNTIKRQALALHIGYEDQRESTADFDYTDMVFTIYIAPQVEQTINPYVLFNLLTDQWWEQNPDNGLTGAPSHPALVTNSDDAAKREADSFKANFDLLAYTPKADPSDPSIESFEDRIYTMKVAEENQTEGLYFLRVKLDEDGAGNVVFVPAVTEEGFPITDKPYYYTEDDVNNFIIHEWNMGNKDVATDEGRAEAKVRFMGLFPAEYDIRETPERWTPAEVEKPILTGDSTNSSYKVMDTDQSVRTIAADIIGFEYQKVPVVNTYEHEPITVDSAPATPEMEELGFLAGEMVQDPTMTEILTPIPGDSIPHRDIPVEQPDGSMSMVRQFLRADPDAAVAMCYVDFYAADQDLRKEVEGIYGVKDKRYSIGFHRSGPDTRFAERHSQDQYEVVSLGQLGFNPYRETVDGDAIAKNSLIDPEGPDRPSYKFAFKYGMDDPTVPNFVFSNPIDGAGIMVVNGNLIIEDVFAYYGLLLVTGDVIVKPTFKPERFVYGADGNPMDAYGHSIKHDGVDWMYVWVDPANESRVEPTYVQLDDVDGSKLRDSDGNLIPVKPLYATGANAFRGQLVTQGNLLINGRLRTESVPNPFAPGEYITGEVHCFASDTANDMSNKLSQIDKTTVDVVSWSAGTIGNSIPESDIQKLWTGDN